MEISHLRYFVHVAQTASFSAAAKLAHVSPPAMTKAIQKLEDEVGVRLLSRTTRRVVLTEAGSALLGRAREALRQVDGIASDLDALRHAVTGELRIGAMEVFSIRLLPRAVSALVGKFPGVVPLSFEMHPASIERRLAEGRLDIGFGIGASASKEVQSELLGTSPSRVVCGRGHPLYGKGRIAKRDLARFPFVVPRFFEREYLPALDQFPDERHSRVIGATIELLQMEVELALSGRYLACLPELSIEHHLADGSLRSLVGLSDLPKFELTAMTRRGVPPKRSAVLLIAELRSALQAARPRRRKE